MTGLDLNIETNRLLLRPFTLDDVLPSYEMNLNEEVTRYTHDGGVKTLEQMRDTIIDNVIGDYEKHGYGRLAVVHKLDNRFIGFCGVKYLDDHRIVGLGYRLDYAYWGKGLATEAASASLQFAFKQLLLKEVFAFTLPENDASIRVLEKLHFDFDTEVIEDGLTAKRYITQANKWR